MPKLQGTIRVQRRIFEGYAEKRNALTYRSNISKTYINDPYNQKCNHLFYPICEKIAYLRMFTTIS